eukprot:CAMPEP_0184499242 /NCGR_PEP_ID=MMETSP0113_2-20130426/40937_1 /TAXON_ID=91329 /ORGANISM="Norrisiella sphaerica, Strain BC52" /LENGTH=438 /DNA_ID=CAMNT_0026887077 /DNA_START=1 /DNA_END=1317 /DNA_ORIENTATION=-
MGAGASSLCCKRSRSFRTKPMYKRSFSGKGRPALRGLVFDMDGTLTKANLDFAEMYRRCGVDRKDDILEALNRMSPGEREKAVGVIEEMEEAGRRALELESGVKELGSWLKYHGIPMALVTRNTERTVEALHKNLWTPLGLPLFDPAISRDHKDIPFKPDPKALEVIAEAWDVPLGPEILMVGDSPSNDVVFGKKAGVTTVLLDSKRRYTEGGNKEDADIVVENLAYLPNLLWKNFEIQGPNAGPLVKYPPPEPAVTPAEKAAATGDVAALKSMTLSSLNGDRKDSIAKPQNPVSVELNPDPSSDLYANPPLVWAVENGHVDCVKVLIEAGVDINAKGYLGATAISRAARNGDPKMLTMLLEAGGNPDIPNIKRQYPLHFAAFKKHRAAVDVLLKHGTSTLSLDRKGRTPAEDTSDEVIREAILKERADRQVKMVEKL